MEDRGGYMILGINDLEPLTEKERKLLKNPHGLIGSISGTIKSYKHTIITAQRAVKAIEQMIEAFDQENCSHPDTETDKNNYVFCTVCKKCLNDK